MPALKLTSLTIHLHSLVLAVCIFADVIEFIFLKPATCTLYMIDDDFNHCVVTLHVHVSIDIISMMYILNRTNS